MAAQDSITVNVDGLSEAVKVTLDKYGHTVISGTKTAAKKCMDQLVKDTKATAPVGHRRARHYKNSISSKKQSESVLSISYIWYVKGSDYRLSHLLENGHALHQGGRVAGTHFIKNASDPILNQFVSKVEEVIRNG